MKTGQSDHYPEIIVQSAGLNQVRYDIQPFTRQNMDGKTISGYSYKYVELEGKITKIKLISAIIRNEFTEEDESTLINNLLSKTDTEGNIRFQELKDKAEKIATEIMAISINIKEDEIIVPIETVPKIDKEQLIQNWIKDKLVGERK